MVDLFKEQLLTGASLSVMASDWIIDRVPFMFSDDRKKFNKWKEDVGSRLNVDGCAISIVGSAGVGFSLNPQKNFKEFNESSDVDVAVISDYHFNYCWHRLRNLGGDYFKLSSRQKDIYQDHIKRLIYWGTIATDRLLPVFDFGSRWRSHLDEISQTEEVSGREVNIRLYKDFDSLRAYQVNNLKSILKTLQEATSFANTTQL